jgi:transcriptional regulator with XRE-family HTH domain
MLTPFGIAARKLRLDKGMRLLDLARLTGYSAAFISAIETGRKSIPSSYVAKVAGAMKLSEAELRELERAADQARKEVRLDKMPADQRELVAAFARRLDSIPPELIEALKKVVLKSLAGEIPFERKRRGLVVPPLSTRLSGPLPTKCVRSLSKTIGSSSRSWTFWNFGCLRYSTGSMSMSEMLNTWATSKAECLQARTASR